MNLPVLFHKSLGGHSKDPVQPPGTNTSRLRAHAPGMSRACGSPAQRRSQRGTNPRASERQTDVACHEVAGRDQRADLESSNGSRCDGKLWRSYLARPSWLHEFHARKQRKQHCSTERSSGLFCSHSSARTSRVETCTGTSRDLRNFDRRIRRTPSSRSTSSLSRARTSLIRIPVTARSPNRVA